MYMHGRNACNVHAVCGVSGPVFYLMRGMTCTYALNGDDAEHSLSVCTHVKHDKCIVFTVAAFEM